MAAREEEHEAGRRAEGGGDGAEVAEERAEVVTYAAAIDVAKGSGMVCTRVPGSRPDRKRQKVWQVDATYASVVALMDHLRCEGIQRLVLESTSDYWRIWYYLAEAAGLEVWLVNARDVKHLPGRGKSDREDSVWLCKLNERGMLRRSFVPPQGIRDLRSLTRTRSRLAQDQVRHQNRVEKILEDALLKISVVISDLFGASGRRFLDALVAGERSPAALAALGDPRLHATQEQLAAALTGQFREVHAFEIATHLRLIDTINGEIARLDARIQQQLTSIPGVAPACTSCGLIGGGHSPGCPADGTPVLGLVERLDEITGVGVPNAQVLIAELGTDMSVFPTPGHAAAWARLTSRTYPVRDHRQARPHRQRQPVPARRPGPGVMAAARTDTRLGEQYRRIARRRGKQKAIVAVSRVICEIACILIADPAARFTDLGADYYSRVNPARQTRSKIREIERLNPGMKVTLTPAEPATTAA